MINKERVIVALDLDHPDQAVALARSVAPIFPFFKIGMKLFTKAGPDLVREVLNHGHVFLDLKFYDIPTVVAEAVSNAAKMGVSLLTVHASGGSEMLRLCMDKLQSSGTSCRLLAVTVLTSFDSLKEFGMERPVSGQVELLAELAYTCNVHGIVSSPHELETLRQRFPSPFLIVTPGIRGADDSAGDQKRIASPAAALKAGADYLVIGRPIIAADDPVQAAQRIAKEIG